MCCKLLLYFARSVISEGPDQFPANIIHVVIFLWYDLDSPEHRLAIMEVFKKWFSVLIALLLFYITIHIINIETPMTFLDCKRSVTKQWLIVLWLPICF